MFKSKDPDIFGKNIQFIVQFCVVSSSYNTKLSRDFVNMTDTH